jgi:dsRNA-specific ribonuclease
MSSVNVKINDDDITMNGDQMIFNPYNPNNHEITLNYVQSILKEYGLPPNVNNLELYKRAFVHRSYTRRPFQENEEQNIIIVERPKNCMPLSTKSNERLEFLGDGVLECITKYYLYRRFPKENEGFMTEKKIALVKNEAIGKLAYDMGLHKSYILSKHADEKNTRTNMKKLGCLFEAFLGALFLDFNKMEIRDEDAWFKNLFVTGPGFQMAQIFLENIFERHVDWIELIQNDDNYKNILQVKIQKEFKVTPHYLEIQDENVYHSHNHNHNENEQQDKNYHMGVYICLGQPIHQASQADAVDFAKELQTFEAIHKYVETKGKILVFLGDGKHKIKRKAEQIACEKSIKYI